MFAKVYPRFLLTAMGKGRRDVRVVLRAMLPVLVVLCFALPVSAETELPANTELVTITHVVDGDTIKVKFADGTTDTVRLIGIDTPETVDPESPVQCFGPEASAKTHQFLTTGREVWLERDTSDRDRYDRLLRYV